MSEKILVPVLGESINEATVSKWLKKEGESVDIDEPIVELETDKVNLEVPSPVSGILKEIKSKDGSTVQVGAVLGSVSENSSNIKKKEIVEKVAKGGQIPAFSFTPPDPNNYFPPTSLEYDPVLAQSLLKEAGVSQEKLPTFEYLYNTSEGHQKLAQAFQQMWKQNLNINVELANTDWKVYLSRQNIGDYTIARAGWIGDYPDPKTFLDMMVSGRGNNQTGWSNDKYDSLLIKAAQSTSQEERFKHFYKAEQILMDELPIIPIYTYTRVYMLNQDVKGWSPNLLDAHPYQFVYLER